MATLIILVSILFLSVGFHFAMQHRICALVGGLVPPLLVALSLLHLQLHIPAALVIAVFPFAIPFAWVTSAFVSGTPWISIVLFIAFFAVLNAGYYALVASVVAWVRRRLSTRPPAAA